MVRSRVLAVLVPVTVAAVTACLVTGAGPAAAEAAQGASRAPLPAHVFAPYFETYAGSSLATLSHDSGAKYLTLAFLQTPARGSCEVAWNSDPTTPVSWSTYGADIRRIRAAGGDVVPSFGGYSADHDGTEIADSCTSVPLIAAAYENVIRTYGVTRIDLDVEDRSLNRPAAIDRRNRAIHLVQEWAAAHHRTVQFVYTLPTGTAGLDPTGAALLQDAVRDGARVQVVNIMTFDYYDGAPHEMARDTAVAADAVLAQLRTVYPRASRHALWSMLGITEMIGIDDFGSPETLTTADARRVERWATARGVAELSFWALQRDNGGCPGTAGSDDCSGVRQAPWQFSRTFEPFTR
ncbi:MAG: chitinase [Actinomycetes bacterium]